MTLTKTAGSKDGRMPIQESKLNLQEKKRIIKQFSKKNGNIKIKKKI